MRKLLLGMSVLLAVSASGLAYAQDVPGSTAPRGATTGLPFVNDGANQPVLQPLTPGAAPITATDAPLDAPVLEGSATPAADGAHEGRTGLPQFNPEVFVRQIFWLAIVFVALYVVFSRFTLPAIGHTITKREQRIAADLGQAENLKHEVERVRGDYETTIAKARSDAQKAIADIQSDMKAELDAKDADFKSASEQAVAQLEMRVRADVVRVGAELESMAAEIATQITAKVAGVTPDASAARDAVDAQTGKMRAA